MKIRVFSLFFRLPIIINRYLSWVNFGANERRLLRVKYKFCQVGTLRVHRQRMISFLSFSFVYDNKKMHFIINCLPIGNHQTW